MKKLSHQTWAKLVALLLATVSGIACIVSLLGLIVTASLDDRISNIENLVNQQIAENYAARLLEDKFDGVTDYDAMDGGNLQYTVASPKDHSDSTNVNQEYEILYSNNKNQVTDQNYDYVFSGSMKDSFEYNTSSMIASVLHPATSWSADHYYKEDSIKEYVFDYEAGKFYAVTDKHYFLVRTIEVYSNDKSVRCYWEKGKNAYINADDDTPLDKSTYQSWYEVYADDSYYIGPDLSDEYHLGFVTTQQLDTTKTFYEDEDYYMSDGILYYPETLDGPIETYYVFMKVKTPVTADLVMNNGIADYFADAAIYVNKFEQFQTNGIMIQIGSLLIFIFSMVVLTTGAGHRKQDEEIHLRWMDKIPFAVYAVATGAGVAYGITANIALVLYGSSGFSMEALIALEIEIAVLWMLLLLGFYLTIVTRLKAHCFWRYTILHYISAPFRKSGRWIKEKNANIKKEMHENISLFWKVMGVLIILFLVELLVIANTEYAVGLELFLFLIYKVMETILVVGIVLQMNSLKEGGKRIAQGDYSEPIDTKGMYWEFKKHAENINAVGNGISLAVDERMKSEHFKTELITNVSHDIKTPLTSIINYVDLMKKENITDPTILEYVDVLDRQSARLKKLIEDLMEASKASTGNLSVNLEQFDASVMLTQVVGEFEERTAANQLNLIVSHPEEPVYIMADGRHLWRVFDNLLSNVCKYAQPGTRVYINLDRKDGNVTITFRNTSKYQLNITSEELMERFVRGDSSRNTEGNGLGLSIAQSLTALQNGTLKLDVDGDLFKVTLTFKEVKEA